MSLHNSQFRSAFRLFLTAMTGFCFLNPVNGQSGGFQPPYPSTGFPYPYPRPIPPEGARSLRIAVTEDGPTRELTPAPMSADSKAKTADEKLQSSESGHSEDPKASGTSKGDSKKTDRSEQKKQTDRTQRRQEQTAQISSGQSAFQNRCVQCHDADKSLQKKKSLSAWRATIARMARQDGAEIPQSEWEVIAVYLASLNSSASTAGGAASADDDGSDADDAAGDMGTVSEVTVFGTISPTLRTNGEDIQNPGFFGDVWGGVAWEPSSGPISAKMVACISCHNEHDEGYLSRLEIVQATLTLDLGKLVRGEEGQSGSRARRRSGGGMCTGCAEDSCLPPSALMRCPPERRTEAFLEAGRMVVPFGAFASQVNPGVYRTVTRPLIFNMGQRVYDEDLGDPVLPMPFSDEGANLNVVVPLFDTVSLNMDAYVVNGLQGTNNINLDDSRDYVDNNGSPSVGGRLTLGNPTLRLGTSVMGGQYNGNDESSPDARELNYLIYGADVTWRYRDILRVQAEFAQRNTDAFYDLETPFYATDKVAGWYVESELLLSRKARLSAIGRWDQQHQHYGGFDPEGTLPSAVFDVNRLTYGVNWTLPGGSLLMFNMEHWFLPDGLSDVDVVGVRWAASF
ncbi:MAG: hypothetical protein R3C49_10425 [Planctomycetaceae bacterium]